MIRFFYKSNCLKVEIIWLQRYFLTKRIYRIGKRLARRYRQSQRLQFLFKKSNTFRIFYKRLIHNRRKNVLPCKIDFLLHVGGFRREHDDNFLLRNHDNKLSVGTISAERIVPRPPELITIALKPVAGITHRLCRRRCLHDLSCCRRGNPFFWQNSPAVPLAIIQIKLSELRHSFRLNTQSPSAGIDTKRIDFRIYIADIKGIEKPRLEILNQLLPRDFLNDSREHIGRRCIVEKTTSRPVIDFPRKKCLHPI